MRAVIVISLGLMTGCATSNEIALLQSQLQDAQARIRVLEEKSVAAKAVDHKSTSQLSQVKASADRAEKLAKDTSARMDRLVDAFKVPPKHTYSETQP